MTGETPAWSSASSVVQPFPFGVVTRIGMNVGTLMPIAIVIVHRPLAKGAASTSMRTRPLRGSCRRRVRSVHSSTVGLSSFLSRCLVLLLCAATPPAPSTIPASRPPVDPNAPLYMLGIVFADPPWPSKATAAQVLYVTASSRAKGLVRVGDAVVAINGQPVGAALEATMAVLRGMHSPDCLKFELLRDGHPMTLPCVPRTPETPEESAAAGDEAARAAPIAVVSLGDWSKAYPLTKHSLREVMEGVAASLGKKAACVSVAAPRAAEASEKCFGVGDPAWRSFPADRRYRVTLRDSLPDAGS